MNKKIILFSFLLCMGVGSAAQEWRGAVQRAWRTAQKAGRSLGKDGEYKAACQTALQLEAVEKAFTRGSRAWFYKNYYSHVEFPLGKSSSCALANGWAVRSNQKNIAHRIWWEHRARLLQKHKEELLKNLRMLPLGDGEKWVSLIPPQSKMIFIGEYHNQHIQYRVEDLLRAYREKYPTRQIILLTEFLPDSFPNFQLAYGIPHAYLNYFREFLEFYDIQFAGLEEETFLLDHTHLPVSGPIGNSAAGFSARNAHWERRIKNWRKLYPRAVFFIYAGNNHVAYEYPGALSQNFKDSFVISFVPLPLRFEPELYYSRELFHAFTQGTFFRQGVLAWKSSRFARLAGFDMQILLRPEHLER